MPEPSSRKHRRNKKAEWRNKEDEDRLAKQYGEVGIKAITAAVELTNDAEKETTRARKSDWNKRNRENGPMNEHEQSTRFADKSTKAARETIERGSLAAEEAVKGAKHGISSSVAGMRELNIKLIEMAHANADAMFDLAQEVAGAQAPSDLMAIWSAHAKRQFELMNKQTREFTELGQKLAS
jgi:hypothetical protein